MRQFIARTEIEPRLQAWLNPEDPLDNINDQFVPRPGGWRIVIELIESTGETSLIRSTWEQTLEEALRHMDVNWPEEPVWKDFATGEIVELKLR